MISGRLKKLKTFAVLFVFLVLITIITVSSLNAVIQPCPVVADVTITQMAQQWVTMFKDPYCDFLKERSSILVRQKTCNGVFSCASQINGIFMVLEESPFSSALKTAGRNTKKIDFKSTGIQEATGEKLRRLRNMASLTAYAAAKDSYERTVQIEKLLLDFAPVTFDHVSKHQAQKDAAKLSRFLGLVQAQELKITSLLKMMFALEGKY